MHLKNNISSWYRWWYPMLPSWNSSLKFPVVRGNFQALDTEIPICCMGPDFVPSEAFPPNKQAF